ncbi:MAG: hypothetical protein A2817_00065 [Candidatus Yanofskybacteria bacterium RIFCSPHIGHO2_01_FULL_39_8b]|uniref:DegT/DnrJ/EryC1/StrS aminotransferase n=1 Tax=Candidatus Yanofskybacteria bacterium RIFCSPHIGHO2_01_FULL_39_8b TaxID=1802659 RepID=A0A1F8ED88_9BACT|nr:MAG: hypothetical protein A2817_00065 [Candidatus Yanofskybacteria bacterium RIFCSPHIGHO2_01_FULL_39_8b]
MFFVHPQIKLNKFKKVNLAQKLESYFPGKQLIFTDMGRSAFKIIIEKLNLQNSEILMPAYLCDIFKPILERYNIKPIFLDIDLTTFHIKIDEMERKITPNTKAVLVCHTYGLLFDIDKLQKWGLPVIEDCAHAFGIKLKSDIAFFSLYKQLPVLRGGLLVCPKDWQIGELPKTSFSFRDFLSLLNCFSLFAFFFKKFGGEIAPKIVRKEKLSSPAGLNNVSLALFSRSLENFEKTLENRKKMALLLQEELRKLGFEAQKSDNSVFCYLSALVPKSLVGKRDEIVQKLSKNGIFCTRIWHTPIILNKEVQEEYKINLADFPNTVEAAQRIINFPLQNHYKEKDIPKIINSIRKVINQL